MSKAHISKSDDKAMGRAGPSSPLPAGISIRNGPVIEDKMDVDEPTTNGNSKRKARNSTSKTVNYNDGSEESDNVPLVCSRFYSLVLTYGFRSNTDILLGKASKDV